MNLELKNEHSVIFNQIWFKINGQMPIKFNLLRLVYYIQIDGSRGIINRKVDVKVFVAGILSFVHVASIPRLNITKSQLY